MEKLKALVILLGFPGETGQDWVEEAPHEEPREC